MADENPSESVRYAVAVPDARASGVYADFAGVWHNNETFVLDFAAMTQPPESTEDQGRLTTTIHAEVVSRVRIPASQVWEVMKVLEQHLSAWESERKPPQR